MNENTEYECELSNSWTLIDLNQNEEPKFVFEACKKDCPNNYPAFANDNDSLKNFSKLNEVSEKVHDHPEEDTQNALVRCEFPKKLEDASHEDSLIIQDKNSDDSDSIEIIDLDGDYRGNDVSCDMDEISKNTQNLCSQGSHKSNDINVIEHERITNVVKRRRKRKISQVDAATSNEFHKLCEDEKTDSDLKMEAYKFVSSPFFGQHNDKFKNAAVSLSLGVIFAGIVCVVIGQILGVKNSSQDLVKTLNALKSENEALQYKISQINTAFARSKHNIYPSNNFFNEKEGKSTLKKGTSVVLSSDLYSLGDYSQDELHKRKSKIFENVYKKANKNRNNVMRRKKIDDFSKLLNYIRNELNALNVNYEEFYVKRLEESTTKISEVLQIILERLPSQITIEKEQRNINKTASESVYVDTRPEQSPRHLNESSFEFTWNSNQYRIDFPTFLCQFPQPEEYYVNKKKGSSKKMSADQYLKESPLFDGYNFHPPKSTLFSKTREKGKIKEIKIDDMTGVNNHQVEGTKQKKKKFKKKKNLHNKRSWDDAQKIKRAKTNSKYNKEQFVKVKLGKLKPNRKYEVSPQLREGRKFDTKHRVWKKSKYQETSDHENHILKNNKTQSFYNYGKYKGKYLNNDGHWQFERAEGRKQHRLNMSNISKKGYWIFKRANGREEIRKGNENDN